MSFCTQCGNSVAAEARFCGKCGSEIKKRETGSEPLPASTDSVVNPQQPAGSYPNRKKQKYSMKVIASAIAIALIIGVYVMSPKQLTEREYEDLVIELIVRDNRVMENFTTEVEYSGINIGMGPDWSEDYKQLVKPAKKLEKDYIALKAKLEGVKPPEYFVYEHETLLKVFNARQNMVSNIISFMSDGDEHNMELSDEYYDRAEDYMEESIFVTEEYEDRLLQAYQQSGMD